MKKTIYVLIAAAGFSITACTDSAQSKKNRKWKNMIPPIKKKGTDTLGMKMGGNELDSKKNNPSF